MKPFFDSVWGWLQCYEDLQQDQPGSALMWPEIFAASSFDSYLMDANNE